MSEIPTLEILNKLIGETNPKIIVDLGSAGFVGGHNNDYLLPSARANPNIQYIAIDNEYTADNLPEKLPNIDYRNDDVLNLQTINDNNSDITLDAYCSSMVLDSKGGYKMLKEMRRITAPNGVVVIESGPEVLQVLPKELEKREKLKELAKDAYGMFKIPDEHNGRIHKEDQKRYSEIYDECRKLVDVPIEDVLNSFGLQVIEKIPRSFDESRNMHNYTYFLKKSIPNEMYQTEILGYDNLVDRLHEELGE